VEKPERFPFVRGLSARQRERRLEQDEGADDVRVDEGHRAVDRTVDVRFGREVDHCGGPMVREGRAHGDAVGDVRLDERYARIVDHPGQVEQASRVRKLVDNDDFP
jgi:hypothetical protein